MNNFGRAQRLALRHRFLLIVSIVCALLVSVFWGANIGAVYPFIEVVFQGKTLHQWIDDRIAAEEVKVAQQRQVVADAQQRGDEKLHGQQSRLATFESTLGHFQNAKPYITRYAPHDPFLTLVAIVGVVLIGLFLKNVFFVVHSVIVDRMSQLAVLELRKQFYRRTLCLDLATFGRDGTSDLMSRFTHDLESLGAGLSQLLGKAVREPLKMAVCMAGAAWVCWRLLLLTMIVAPVAAFLIVRLAKLLKRANRKAMEEMSQIYNILEETFQGIKVVKAFTMERYERRRFHQLNKNYFFKSMRIAKYDALTHPATEVMGMVMICLALLAGAYLVLNQQTHLFGILMSNEPLTLGSLILFYGMLAGTTDPARKLSDIFNRLQRASAAADRVYSLLDREPEIRDPVRPQPALRHRRDLVFENVRFSYVPGTPVLESIDLRIPAGETLAIVGPNGCGKSTLANLIPRFFDPNEGRVLLDGVDVRDLRLSDLRGQIGMVAQETLLFDDTVFNNIRYGSPRATREEVIDAARRAHAHRFIEERLENGYDTIVGPRGGQLSGGQRQRIALARAILRNPAILILDEATSQIDVESEQLIHKVLEQFIRHRTAVIITHRTSTLSLADRILVMDLGRMVDIGTHDELTRRSDFYRRFCQTEFRESA